jgi:hypothetical protein
LNLKNVIFWCVIFQSLIICTGCSEKKEYHFFPASNAPTTATVTTPAGIQFGNITVNYSLIDADEENCSIAVQYSTDGGANWSPAAAAGGEGLTELATAAAGAAHTFIWDSLADHVGMISPENNARIKIIPYGRSTGSEAVTGNFTVNNVPLPPNGPPGVEITISPADPERADVVIPYRLFDLEGDNCDIRVEYALDNSGAWLPATYGGGTGNSNLAANSTGVNHTYVWDSITDNIALTAPENTVRIKITPVDAAVGEPGVTDEFILDNRGPEAPANPDPADGEKYVLTGVILDWDNSALAEGYYVFFGNVSDPPYVADVADSQHDPGPLDFETPYYWKVIAHNAAGNSSTTIWTFRTKLPDNVVPALINTSTITLRVETGAIIDTDAVLSDTFQYPGAVRSSSFVLYNRSLADLLPADSMYEGVAGYRPPGLDATVALSNSGEVYIFGRVENGDDNLCAFACGEHLFMWNYHGFDMTYLDNADYLTPHDSVTDLDIRHNLLGLLFGKEFVYLLDNSYLSGGPQDHLDLYNLNYWLRSNFTGPILLARAFIKHEQFDDIFKYNNQRRPIDEKWNSSWSPIAYTPDQFASLSRSFDVQCVNPLASRIGIATACESSDCSIQIVHGISDACPDYTNSGGYSPRVWQVVYDNAMDTYEVRNDHLSAVTFGLKDEFPTRVEMSGVSKFAYFSDFFSIALLGDDLTIDNRQESPAPGDDGNPPPMVMTIFPGWTWAGNAAFTEDWDTGIINPTIWRPFGLPGPQLSADGHNYSSNSFDSNGDFNNSSGVVSLEEFPWTGGCVYSAWIKVTDSAGAGLNNVSFMIGRDNASAFDEINDPSVARFTWSYDIAGDALVARFYNGADYTTARTETRDYIALGMWHHFEIEITASSTVRFWIDNRLFAESDATVDLGRGSGPIVIKGFSNDDPHSVDDITIHFGGH